MPGIIGLLTLLVTIMVTALSVAREREQGTFDQLLVTPLRPMDILLGKSLPGLVIGFAEATLMVLIVTQWFGVPLRGSLLTFYAGLGSFLLSGIGIGLMISSLSVTMQQGLLGAFLFMVPAILLSGFATPVANMPEWLQTLTLLNPLRYFMVVLRGVFVEGASFMILWPQFWPMLLIGSVTLTAAARLFRYRSVLAPCGWLLQPGHSGYLGAPSARLGRLGRCGWRRTEFGTFLDGRHAKHPGSRPADCCRGLHEIAVEVFRFAKRRRVPGYVVQ